MITNEHHILSRKLKSGLAIILNRPEALNSLSEEMIDSIDSLLNLAEADPRCRFVLFYSSSPRGFCAGGDVRELARLGRLKQYDKIDSFFRKEYGLDLRIHLFSKPVIVLADGVTMGGGLGIAAGAGISIVTERTRMAMPETRIGFFPDVGSTGWMFTRCPKGYPEYLGLTGYDMIGRECVRLGFATHYMKSDDIPQLIEKLENIVPEGQPGKESLYHELLGKISDLTDSHFPGNPAMDAWVEKYFAGKSDIREILKALTKCYEQEDHCNQVFINMAERSPTALVLTLKLLRYNEGRPIEDVFATELKAAKYITRHSDYIEGVRARLVDRDDAPKWNPDRIEHVDPSGFNP
ncbi:MAG: enoyl-CoA hydratase/isomerase family protein [Deltaproteobacteria bacterium]